MGMRTDCRHYSRRTGAGSEVTETCDVGAAPDAPLRCPADCPQFEARKLSTVAFDYGSLAEARAGRGAGEDAGTGEATAEEEALFAQLRGVVDAAAGDAVAAEAERRQAEETRKARARRKRIR